MSTTTSNTLEVDVLVIGWGKGGKTLAAQLSDAGRSVAIAERSPAMYGGTCINIGCVPTKDLITAADERRREDAPGEYFRTSLEERHALVAKLNAANHAALASRPDVTILDGAARLTGPHDAVVSTAEGDIAVHAESIIIGTGAQPARLNVPGEDSPVVFDSTTIQQLENLPPRLVVIGGGFIGAEFASMFAGFGSEVVLLNRSAMLFPQVDDDVRPFIEDALTDRGVRVVNGVEVTSIEDGGEGTATVRTDSGDFDAEAVLVAVGRVADSLELGLDVAGVDRDERGFIRVDGTLRTNHGHIFAVGDVNGGLQHTYISLDDGRIVADQILGGGQRRTDDRVAVPVTTFLTPPLSQVGLTEREAREAGYDVKVASKAVAAIAAMPRPKIVGNTHGVIKFVTDSATEQILGATVFSVDSQEVINLIALAMRLNATVRDLRDGLWTHPSSTEALNEVLQVIG
ncbi:NAD(P)/FAD-dependent oxidoreductase [Curtobacterium sp. MCBA15_008]|uniref:dihydrolipoyl dehydrogenase family protein n=1 Tax=Curtobacterium sp. MCBA15_008 TaxID=1898736 RepID=UPI0008DD46A9|nr:FAD-dependent oxidoreductase [Curtobacterium sp. MCBA15_008]OII06909.1 pyridine nucleotide-disulfide oxidoreductase [Curtobacterium sp. MCBA15_008]